MPRKNARPAAKKARAKLKARMTSGRPSAQQGKRRPPAMRFSHSSPPTFELRIAAHHLLKGGW